MIKFFFKNDQIAFYGFILITLGFISYSIFVSLGFFPPFLGGWYGFANLLILIFMVLNFKDFFNNFLRFNYYGLLVFIFYIYVIGFSSIYLFTSSINLISPYTHFILNLLYGFILFYLGLNLKFDEKLKFFLQSFFIISCILLFLYFIQTGNFMLNTAKNAAEFLEGEEAASYQTFGRTGFLCLSLLIFLLNSFYRILLVQIGGIFILFFLGARSETLAFIFISSLFLFLKTQFKLERILLLLSLFLLFLIFIISNTDLLYETRFGQLLDFSTSTSWQARQEFYNYGLEVIRNNPFLGEFGSSYIKYNDIGANPHHIIAAWSNFGILGFVLFILCCLIPVLSSFYYIIFRERRDLGLYFTAIFGLCCVFLLFSSKSIFWIIPPFYWGIYLGYFKKV
ncbi:O-antigen ligase family protein [Acinetobacter radioresistens]|uniref:O-antigen ligase family protein n=1 Tax=Acinetobacter radioresistens TaxID=40216 RepID=UPI0032631812